LGKYIDIQGFGSGNLFIFHHKYRCNPLLLYNANSSSLSIIPLKVPNVEVLFVFLRNQLKKKLVLTLRFAKYIYRKFTLKML